MMRRLALFALAIALSAPAARADILTVLSYDTPNGYGQASGGTFNYWDGNYTGSGNKTTDGAPLTGGVGALTDGVVTNQPWYNVENVQGTGPYVGWLNINPTITFHLAGAPTYQTVRVHVDDSDVGGVSAPISILVDDGQGHSETFSTSNVNSGTVRWLDMDVTGLNLSGNTVKVTLNQSNLWVFSDEIQFIGSSSAVPEPSVPVLAGFVLALAAGARRLRPRHAG